MRDNNLFKSRDFFCVKVMVVYEGDHVLNDVKMEGGVTCRARAKAHRVQQNDQDQDRIPQK